MHKSSKILLLALPLMVVAAAAVGCGETEHAHTYSSDWAFNAEAHWHPSSCSHDTKTNKSAHAYTDIVVPPTVTSAGYTLHICGCGYSYASDEKDSLPSDSGELRYNENGHWKSVLSADGQIEIEDHEYTDSTVAPTCSTSGYTKHACKCGYWYASAPTEPTPHSYDEAVWGHDQNSHWHPALCCDQRAEITAHDFTESVTPATCDTKGYTEFTCKDCGYSYRGRETAASHSFAEALSSDEYEHWRVATCEHTTQKADAAEHVFVGTSNVCEVCGKEITRRLAYELSGDGEYYIVTGKGCIEADVIEIPDTYRGKKVQEIASRAFKDAEITSVAFGGNIKKIGTEAFAGTKISAAVLPDGIEELGTRAFANTNIVSVTLGASLQKLGYAVFRNCLSLQTVTIGGSLSVLPPYAFEGCSKLESVTCNTKPTEVGAQAFLNCTNLTALDLSACTKVGFSAFGGCEKFVPDFSALAVAEEYAFSGCAVETANLPATLTQIGDNLFNGCTKLTAVAFTAKSVGGSAFAGCTSLNAVTMSGVELIGGGAFQGCTALTSLTLPDSVLRVGENAFRNSGLIQEEGGVQYAAGVAVGVNSGVSSVTIKAGVKGIADGAFRDLTSLTAVSLGGVRFIGVSAFRACDKLTAITFTASVKVIGANAFRESGLTSVEIPATVESIGDNAFYDCKSLSSATVNAKEIGRFAFSYTGVDRTLDSPVKGRPDYAKLATVTLGSNVTAIGSNAFQYCPVTQITLSEKLTSIGKYAFAQTDLNSITIPASVTRIGEYAFYESKITSATFADTQNWKAGKTSLSLGTPAQNATYLKQTYRDIDWIKG